jgi:Domain of unknown function (DUF4402)
VGIAAKIIATMCVCLSWAASPAFAAPPAAKTGAAEAIVLRPLSFIKIDDLNFGRIFPSNTAGTVTLSPTGTRTTNNGIVLIGVTHEPARFGGQGAVNQQVAISISSSTILINGPGASMRVRNFVIGSTPTAVLGTTPRRFTISNPAGTFAFPVGATLEVGANQAPGQYTGNWNITLNYM